MSRERPSADDLSRLWSRTALVTGGDSGIGAALALLLSSSGANVAVADIDLESAQAVASRIGGLGRRAICVQLDVTKPASWLSATEAVEAALGPIEVLCSNAGVSGAMRPLVSLAPEALRWVFETNCMSALHALQAVVPGMLARGRGWVLFTGSTSALSTLPGFGDYCASKHALLALAETLRKEVQSHDVNVSLFCAASVRTGLTGTTHRALPPELTGAFDRTDPAAQATRAAAIAAAGGADGAVRGRPTGLARSGAGRVPDLQPLRDRGPAERA